MPNEMEAEAAQAEFQQIGHEYLQTLFKSWNSRYKYTITFRSQLKRVLNFETSWCRRPTPHEPLPDVRVSILFSLKYPKTAGGEEALLPSAKHYAGVQPGVSYRIAHEKFVHTSLSNFDLNILRVLKFKTQFFKRNVIDLEQAGRYESRLTRERAAVADAEEEQGGQQDASSLSSQDIEKYLIKMFAEADNDGNGNLDAQEVQEMLMNSDLKFTKDDVDVVLNQGDENGDGLLVYREFIPIAIDLVQARQASRHAAQLVEKSKAEARLKAVERVQAAKKLPRHVEQLSVLDLEGSGALSVKQMQTFLSQLPGIPLSDAEVDLVLKGLPRHDSGDVLYQRFLSDYENVLASAIETLILDQSASNVEQFLNLLFKKQDTANAGCLLPAVIAKVLQNCERIRLSTTQIHAIVAGHPAEKPLHYKSFAKQTAFMIYKLFDKTSLKEKTNIIRRSAITPIELLGAKSRKLILQQMRSKFREFDSNDSGLLEPSEFFRCLSDTSLILSQAEMDNLREEADLDGDGLINMKEFMKFAYDTLLHLARDAALESPQFSIPAEVSSS